MKKTLPKAPTILVKTREDWHRFAKRWRRYPPTQKFLAYKFGRTKGLTYESPLKKSTTPRLSYTLGGTMRVTDADTNTRNGCGRGVNVATRDWIERVPFWAPEDGAIFLVEFTARDIAAVPCFENGKFRLFRCRVVAKVSERGVPVL